MRTSSQVLSRRSRVALLWVAGLLAVLPARADDVVVALGAVGEEVFAERFAGQVARWREVAAQADASFALVEAKGALRGAVEPGPEAAGWLWVVFVGHGTFDGRDAKFNLAGEDVSAREFGQWLEPVDRPLVFVNTTASSAPFLRAASADGRITVTATKDASEASATIFGDHFGHAVGAAEADLDRDGGISVLEAFLFASRKVKDSYEADGRLASEEAMLDDTGDGKGVLATAFAGVVPNDEEAVADGNLPDGVRAHQVALVPNPHEAARSPEWRAERDRLEVELFRLRARREKLDEDDYYTELEPLLARLAELYIEGDGE